MAIILRYGEYKDFHPEKMRPAEVAVILSGDPHAVNGRSAYVCFSAGIVKQLATYEDMVSFIKDATSDVAEELAKIFTEDIEEATTAANAAATAANTAATAANTASDSAEEAATAATNAANAATEAIKDAVKISYSDYENFPEAGNQKTLYVDDTVDPALMYIWNSGKDTYVPVGGTGGGSSSADIPLTLLSTGWAGTAAPYTQTLTVPQMREGITPPYFFSGTSDDELYAFYLITGCTAGYAEITFTAADLPAMDIHLTLKGVPAQELEVVDNQVVFLVEPSAFSLNEEFDRYEANITVEGMTAGYAGQWGIVRSGSVLSIEESKIAASITDVDRLDGAVRIVCLELPAQRYMMSISGAYPDAEPGTVILSGMQGWFDRVEELENNVTGYHEVSATDSYFKFPDGTLIYCKTLVQQNYTPMAGESYPGGFTVIFPDFEFLEVTFSKILSVNASPYSSAAITFCGCNVSFSGESPNGISGIVFSRAKAITQTYYAYMTVIGRWK